MRPGRGLTPSFLPSRVAPARGSVHLGLPLHHPMLGVPACLGLWAWGGLRPILGRDSDIPEVSPLVLDRDKMAQPGPRDW